MHSFFSEKNYAIFEKGPVVDFDMFFNRIRMKIDSPLLDRLFLIVARLDHYYPILIVTYAYIIYTLADYMIIWQMLLLLVISDQSSKWLFKRKIRRMRPYKWFMAEGGRLGRKLPEQELFDKFAHTYSWVSFSSMCSSHAANFSAQALFIYHLLPDTIYWLLPLFYLVGIGRWYIGGHWFSDVLVGWLLGYFSVFILLSLVS